MLKVSVELEIGSKADTESAEGEVEYEVKMNETVFEVEIKGVSTGLYGFYVDTVKKGTLDVLSDGEKTKLKFSDPQKDGWEALDFVPWDTQMEVIKDGDSDPILEVNFPSEP